METFDFADGVVRNLFGVSKREGCGFISGFHNILYFHSPLLLLSTALLLIFFFSVCQKLQNKSAWFSIAPAKRIDGKIFTVIMVHDNFLCNIDSRGLSVGWSLQRTHTRALLLTLSRTSVDIPLGEMPRFHCALRSHTASSILFPSIYAD